MWAGAGGGAIMTDAGYGLPSGDLTSALHTVGRTLLSVLAVGLSCATPTEIPAPPRAMLIGAGSHGSPREAAQLASLGTLARITYYAGDDRPAFRHRVDRLQARGLDVLVVQHTFARDTVAEIVALASIPGITIQVLNEADTRLTGAQYADLMRRVVAAVPAQRFIGMGLATVNQFAAQYVAADGPVLRAFAVHCYGVALAPSVAARVQAAQHQLRGTMPVVITEMGVDAAGITTAWPGAWTAPQLDALQAREIAHGLRAAHALGVERVYLYQLESGGDFGFSLLRHDGSERPVMHTIREMQ